MSGKGKAKQEPKAGPSRQQEKKAAREAEALLQRGEQAWQAKDFEGALAGYQGAAEKQPQP